MSPISTLKHRQSSGAALLAVLWVISLLIGLVAGAMLLLGPSLDAATARRQTFRARMLAEGALAIAFDPSVKPDDPLLRRQLSEDEGYVVEKVGEDARLNPNILLGVGTAPGATGSANSSVLENLFIAWGLKTNDAQAVVRALTDWVDSDNGSKPGAQKTEKGGYPFANMPFNIPFRSVEEMSLVKGMDLVERANPDWRSWFSIYASGSLDLTSARAELISFITKASMQRAQQFRSITLGADGILGTQDDGQWGDVTGALNYLSTSGTQLVPVAITSPTNRYLVKVQVGNLRREVSAVISGGTPPKLTYLSETSVSGEAVLDQPTR